MATGSARDYAREFARNLCVVNTLGMLSVVFGASMLLPLAVAWWTEDGASAAHAEAMAATCLIGGLAWLLTRRFRREHARRSKPRWAVRPPGACSPRTCNCGWSTTGP